MLFFPGMLCYCFPTLRQEATQGQMDGSSCASASGESERPFLLWSTGWLKLVPEHSRTASGVILSYLSCPLLKPPVGQFFLGRSVLKNVHPVHSNQVGGRARRWKCPQHHKEPNQVISDTIWCICTNINSSLGKYLLVLSLKKIIITIIIKKL